MKKTIYNAPSEMMDSMHVVMTGAGIVGGGQQSCTCVRNLPPTFS